MLVTSYIAGRTPIPCSFTPSTCFFVLRSFITYSSLFLFYHLRAWGGDWALQQQYRYQQLVLALRRNTELQWQTSRTVPLIMILSLQYSWRQDRNSAQECPVDFGKIFSSTALWIVTNHFVTNIHLTLEDF